MVGDLFSPPLIMMIVALVTALALLRPKIISNPEWRAVVTPLASIIGSGFLVAGPILAHVAGPYAWAAMLALCLLAYVYGEAIRHNIRTIEPLDKSSMPKAFLFLEEISDLALAFAYFVSVAYYINLFAAYALRADDIIDPFLSKVVASSIIVILGGLGALRGLRAFENLEAITVAIKLALISGLLAALLIANMNGLAPPASFYEVKLDIPVLLGLVILVQGFEISRYLGAEHDTETRIRTMKKAQLLSTLIYVVFIVLMTPFFTGLLPEKGSETEIITLLMPLGAIVAPLVIFAALASQISAAIADVGGAGGLLNEASGKRLSLPASYLLTAVAALGITWQASIMEIIVYASKAFVFYYCLQSALAFLSTWRSDRLGGYARSSLFVGAFLIGILVLVLGSPVAAQTY